MDLFGEFRVNTNAYQKHFNRGVHLKFFTCSLELFHTPKKQLTALEYRFVERKSGEERGGGGGGEVNINVSSYPNSFNYNYN